MAAAQSSVHGWVAIGVSVVALIVTCLWNLHLARQAKCSADAAEKMAAIASDTHKSQVSPRLTFDTYERTKLRVVNESDHSVKIESFRHEGLGIKEAIASADPVVLRPSQSHDYRLGDLLLKVARDDKEEIRGWLVVNDLRGRRWKQEWGFASDGQKAWGAGIEELRT